MKSSADNDRIIESCSHCGQEMDVSALRPFSNAICPSCKGNTRVLRQMGAYRIIEKIGVGGMSVVYRARDTILGRDVALKVLNETYGAQAERIARFEDEAKLMAKVQHEHMVQVYSVGQQWGCFYIAMELVDGGDLETYVRDQGAIPEPHVLEVAIQVADGLEAAWAAGMLHRDIKPANILIDSATGVAKVVDFGLSLLNTQVCRENEVWATPYYASPETLLQQNEDFRSDMYALGCSLFQLLVGKPPFEEIPQSITALLELKKKLPPLQKVAPEISPATCKIINRLMEYQPQKRYDSYELLKKDLLSALTQLHNSPQDWTERRTTLIRRAARAKVRNITLVSVGSIAAIALIGMVVVNIINSESGDEGQGGSSEVPGVTNPGTVDHTPGSNSGELYLNAEAELKKKDIQNARRIFSSILADPKAPVSTYSWAAFQSALCSWCIGSRYDGDMTLRQLVEKLDSAEKERMTSGVNELSGIVRYLVSTEADAKKPEIKENSLARPYYLVGDSLKSWENHDYKTTMTQLDHLERMANDGKNAQLSEIAGTWIAILEPLIKDARILTKVGNMPESTEYEIQQKRKAIEENSGNQSSPGIAYRQSLKLMESSLDASMADLKNRVDHAIITIKDDVPNSPGVVMLGENTDKTAVNFDEVYTRGMQDMQMRWHFGHVARQFDQAAESIEDVDQQIELMTLSEMAKLVDDLITETGKDIAKVPLAKRVATLTDGVKVSITGMTADELLIDNHPEGKKSVPIYLLGPEAFITLHRNIVYAGGGDPDIIRKRHAAAVVFLYLTGQKELAEKTGNILINSDADFAKDWKRWMLVVNH